MKIYKQIITAICGMGLMVCAGAVFANTPDGSTPSEESECDGIEGKAKGLCIAYCEAMDCDADPNATQKACDTLGAKLTAAHGSIPCVDEATLLCPCWEGETLSSLAATLNLATNISSPQCFEGAAGADATARSNGVVVTGKGTYEIVAFAGGPATRLCTFREDGVITSDAFNLPLTVAEVCVSEVAAVIPLITWCP